MKKNFYQIFIVTLSLIFIFDYSVFAEGVQRKKIAISGFKGILIKYEYSNNTRYSKESEIDLTDSLTDKLVQYKSIGILERSRLDSAIKEMGLSQSGLVEKSKEFGKLVGADYLALGVITNIGDKSEIGVRVIEIETGIIVSSKTVKFDNTKSNVNLLEIVDYLSMEVAVSLGEKIEEKTLNDKRNSFQNYESNQTFWYVTGGVLLVGGLLGANFLIKELGLGSN